MGTGATRCASVTWVLGCQGWEELQRALEVLSSASTSEQENRSEGEKVRGLKECTEECNEEMALGLRVLTIFQRT